jgi:hypothetical protein
MRKGAGRFASERLLRLGLPFAVYTLAVWPVTEYLMLRSFADPGSYWEYVRGDEPMFDNGPMWFVGVLLLCSLGYVAVARHRTGTPPRTPLRGRYLVGVAVAVGASSFLLRTVFPIGSDQFLNLHLWQWPQVLGAFCLGAIAGERGWLRPVDARVARRCGLVTLAVGVAVGASVMGTIALGGDEEGFSGGWGIAAFFAAASEGALVVAGSIWVLRFAQRHLDTTSTLRRAAARASYAAFMLQGPVLVALAMALRPLNLSGDLKAFAVAAGGIVASFAVAHVLVTRTAMRRVL